MTKRPRKPVGEHGAEHLQREVDAMLEGMNDLADRARFHHRLTKLNPELLSDALEFLGLMADARTSAQKAALQRAVKDIILGVREDLLELDRQSRIPPE